MCEFLPWWDAWLGPALGILLILGPIAFVLEVIRMRVARKLGPLDSAHWTERARRAALLRAEVRAWTVTGTVLAVYAIYALRSRYGCLEPALPTLGATLLCFFLALRTAGRIEAVYTGVERRFSERLRSLATMLLLLRPSLLTAGLAVALSGLAPRGAALWIWVAAVALALYVSSVGIYHPIAKSLGLMLPAREKTLRAVERARDALKVPVHDVCELVWSMPNALAFPLRARVAFTQVLVDAADEDELYAIALHELGHLKESRFTSWFRPALGFAALPFAVALPFFRQRGFVEIVWLGVACVMLVLFGIRRSRRHEHEADAHAIEHSPSYARALERIYRLAGIPAVLGRSGTHPHLYDRMLAAGVTPDYPRPAPPKSRAMLRALLLVPVVVLGLESIAEPLRGALGRFAVAGRFETELDEDVSSDALAPP